VCVLMPLRHGLLLFACHLLSCASFPIPCGVPRSKFRCPQHYCALCGESGNSNVLCSCMMCANSYHVKCLVVNKDVMLRLTYRYGICADHEEAKTVQQSSLCVLLVSCYVRACSPPLAPGGC
jgi:hypothetical protein